MSEADTDAAPPRAGMRLSRGRGAVSGVVLVLAGIWGAFVPFVGPSFHFAYTPRPHDTWHWTAARGWFEVLPGGVAVLGGLLLILSANRIVTSFGAWIAALAGGWFVVGQQVSYLLTLGSPGAPSAKGDRRYVAEYLAFFTGLGALIILFAAIAIGRLSVHSTRDARAAARRDAADQGDDFRADDYRSDGARSDDDPADDYRSDDVRADDYRRDDDRRIDAGRVDDNRDDAGRDDDRPGGAYAAGQRSGGYGTPGTSGPGDSDSQSSAVTTELPVAGAASAGALYAGERQHDDHSRDNDDDHSRDNDDDHSRDDDDDHSRDNDDDADRDTDRDADPDTDRDTDRETDRDDAVFRAPQDVSPEPTAPEPVGPEPDAPQPTEPQQTEPQPVTPEPAVPQPTEPEPVASEPAEPQRGPADPSVSTPQADPPLLLEPPEGHPDAERFRARTGAAQDESTGPSADPSTSDHDAPAESSTTWNPAAQSPTTTGEMPAFRSAGQEDPAPASGRGIRQPRRYYGPNNPAPEADDGHSGSPSGRDTVRTDETIDQDLDHEMDLDERPS